MEDGHCTDPSEEMEESLVLRVTETRIGVYLQGIVITERGIFMGFIYQLGKYIE